MILQTQEVYPNNRMHWKFFELSKFQESNEYSIVGKNSDLKHQWLEFLIDCSNQTNKPDRANIIKKGYEIMKVATWNHDDKVRYWKEKQSIQEAEDIKREAAEKAKAAGKLEGKLEAIKQLLPTLKKYILKKHSHEDNVEDFPLLQEKQVSTIERHVLNERQNCDCNADALAELLGLGSKLQLDIHNSDLE